jgi:hypothetical protein
MVLRKHQARALGRRQTELRLGAGYAPVEFVYPIDFSHLATQITVPSCLIWYPE